MARDRTESEGSEPGSPEAGGLSIEALSAEAASLAEDERIGAHAREVNLRILAIDPTNLAAGNRLAKCLRADGDLAGARAQLERTLEAHPGNAVSLGELNLVERREQLREEAENALLEQGPAALAGRADRAKVEERDWLLQLEARQVLAEAEASPQALAAKAAVLRRLGFRTLAEETLEMALELDPSPASNAHTFAALGALRKDQGRLDDSIELYEQVLAVHPSSVHSLVGLVAALLDRFEQHHSPATADAAAARLAHAWRLGKELEISPAERRMIQSEYQRLESLRERLG